MKGLQDAGSECGGTPLPLVIGGQEVPVFRQGDREEVKGALQAPSAQDTPSGEDLTAGGTPGAPNIKFTHHTLNV